MRYEDVDYDDVYLWSSICHRLYILCIVGLLYILTA